MKRVGILGEGAWGTALATVLAHNGHEVKLWCHDAAVAQSIATTGINARYMPGIQLGNNVKPVLTIEDAVCDAEYVIEAIPVKFLRSVLEQAKPCYRPGQCWVILSKGIENDTLLLPSQIFDAVFGGQVASAVLSGPSFALDVAEKQPTGVVIASADAAVARAVCALVSNDYFTAQPSSDVIGVQIGGAVKNVVTLGIGMLEGAGYRDNAKALFLTRGLQEMVTLAAALGGQRETMYGLAGVGDLVLTAMGELSRNLAVGMRLGQGEKLDDILKETGFIPEGVNTVKSIYQLIEQRGLELPLCKAVHQVIFAGQSVCTLL